MLWRSSNWNGRQSQIIVAKWEPLSTTHEHATESKYKKKKKRGWLFANRGSGRIIQRPEQVQVWLIRESPEVVGMEAKENRVFDHPYRARTRVVLSGNLQASSHVHRIAIQSIYMVYSTRLAFGGTLDRNNGYLDRTRIEFRFLWKTILITLCLKGLSDDCLSVCLGVSYQPIALCGIHWACFGHNSVEHLKLTVSSLVVIPYPLIQYTRTYTFRHVLPCADDCMTVEERRERHWPL